MDYEMRIEYKGRNPVGTAISAEVYAAFAGIPEKQKVVESARQLTGEVRWGSVYDADVARQILLPANSGIAKLLQDALSVTLFRMEGKNRPSIDKLVIC